MVSLKAFHVDEKKVWFTGGFWPKDVPKQFYEIKDLQIKPLYQNFVDQAKKNHFWDKELCYFVLGNHIEKTKFSTLIEKAQKFGTFLRKIGVEKGDVVALDLPNSINFIVCYLGTLYIGAIAAPVNPNYRPNEALHEFNLIGAKVLVLMDFVYFSGISLILEKTNIQHVIHSHLLDFISAEGEQLETLKSIIPSFQEKIPQKVGQYETYRLKQVLEQTEPVEIKIPIDPWKDPAVYLMTGGTTGLPKVAKLSHANLISDLFMLKTWTQLKSDMICIGIIPFFHSYGMTAVMNASLTLGMRMLLFPKPPPEEVLCSVLNDMEAPEGIVYVGVEILFKRLTDFVKDIGYKNFREKYNIWQKLIYAIQGAGPLREDIRLGFEEIFCPIRVGYGLTETSPVVSIDPFWGLYKPGKIGLPLPGTEWAIFDTENFEAGPICDGSPDNDQFGPEYVGEICVAGPQVMLGYLNEEEIQENNIKQYKKKRWILTGDIGYQDQHGFCKIIDRKKSLIKVSGNSVFPKEVEGVLKKIDIVDEVAVAGLPDKETGEAVKAWITIKKNFGLGTFLDMIKGKKFNPEILRQICEEKLAPYKVPKYIEIIRKFPKTITYRILIEELVEEDLERLKKGKKIKGEKIT